MCFYTHVRGRGPIDNMEMPPPPPFVHMYTEVFLHAYEELWRHFHTFFNPTPVPDSSPPELSSIQARLGPPGFRMDSQLHHNSFACKFPNRHLAIAGSRICGCSDLWRWSSLRGAGKFYFPQSTPPVEQQTGREARHVLSNEAKLFSVCENRKFCILQFGFVMLSSSQIRQYHWL